MDRLKNSLIEMSKYYESDKGGQFYETLCDLIIFVIDNRLILWLLIYIIIILVI